MPRLMNTDADQAHKTLSAFQFSGVEVDKLEGSEYTIVEMLVDESGSVSGFVSELTNSIKTVVDACKKSPRSENLLFRAATFNSGYKQDTVNEIHGFCTLSSINTDDYDGKIQPGGGTPLYDATLNAVEALQSYGATLHAQDYFCNGIFFVITDGEENDSKIARGDTGLEKIKNALQKLKVSETLDSVKAILIGVNDQDANMQRYLKEFKDKAGFDEYISVGDATAGKLAKLAQFVSRSISSTSQALGSNGPSKPVDFDI
jgi:hypothetical protein